MCHELCSPLTTINFGVRFTNIYFSFSSLSRAPFEQQHASFMGSFGRLSVIQHDINYIHIIVHTCTSVCERDDEDVIKKCGERESNVMTSAHVGESKCF
jgi:hypothetical protein